MAKKPGRARRKSHAESSPQGSRLSTGLGRLWVPLLLFVVVVGIYLPSVGHGFLYDDYEVILSNAPLRSIEDLGRILTERHFLSLPYYRPVVRSSLLLQRTLHGDQPGPFHLFNVFVAGWIALIAYALLRLPVFGLRPRWAFLAAVVFVVHPVASSCVYPIASGRETLLPALFILLALYCFLRAGPWWRVGASASFALALFGKEQAVVTLAIFVLADGLGLTSAAPGRSLRRWLVRYWPEAAIGAVYFSIRHFLFAGGEYRLGDLGQFALSYLYALQVVTVPFWELVYEPPVRGLVQSLAPGRRPGHRRLGGVVDPEVLAPGSGRDLVLAGLVPSDPAADSQSVGPGGPFCRALCFPGSAEPGLSAGLDSLQPRERWKAEAMDGPGRGGAAAVGHPDRCPRRLFPRLRGLLPAVGEDRSQVAQRPQQPGGGVDHGRPAARGGQPL